MTDFFLVCSAKNEPIWAGHPLPLRPKFQPELYETVFCSHHNIQIQNSKPSTLIPQNRSLDAQYYDNQHNDIRQNDTWHYVIHYIGPIYNSPE